MRALFLSLLLAGAGATLDRGTATIATTNGPVSVQVEIADSDDERRRGLMGRRSLPAPAGMLFVYREDRTGSFWMKNTLIPLDIAFVDARGRIVRILQMTPCRSEPCRLYSPRATYRAALEVNAGSFRRWKVRVGDRLSYRVSRR